MEGAHLFQPNLVSFDRSNILVRCCHRQMMEELLQRLEGRTNNMFDEEEDDEEDDNPSKELEITSLALYQPSVALMEESQDLLDRLFGHATPTMEILHISTRVDSSELSPLHELPLLLDPCRDWFRRAVCLKRLHLDSLGLGQAAGELVAALLHANLSELHLFGAHLTEDFFPPLRHGLQETRRSNQLRHFEVDMPETTLQNPTPHASLLLDLCSDALQLEQLKLVAQSFAPSAIRRLTHILRSLRGLQLLDLGDNDRLFLEERGRRQHCRRDMDAFFRAVARHKTLNTLNLHGCQFRNGSLGRLLEHLILEENAALKTLVASNADPTVVTIHPCWVRHIPRLPHLQYLFLSLDGNDPQWPMLVTALKHNPSICSCNIRGVSNDVVVGMCKNQLWPIFQRNELLVKAQMLELAGANLDDKLVPVVLQRFGRLPHGASAMFSSLRNIFTPRFVVHTNPLVLS